MVLNWGNQPVLNEEILHRDTLFLSLAEDEGQDKLMRRRGQLLAKDHVELTEVLSSPPKHVRDSYESEPVVTGDLDDSKRDALAQMSKVLIRVLLVLRKFRV